MDEMWREIAMFPGYSVSESGQVRNDKTERRIAVCVNGHGIAYVGLSKDGRQYKKSLSIIVLEAFVPRPSFRFDAPINLNGDRLNNSVDNLMWRPRWFATKFFQQFMYNSVGSINGPLEVIETGEVFENSWDAVTTLGVLDREIAISVMTKNWVFPIHRRFRRLL